MSSSLIPLVDAIKKMSATELHLVPGERIFVIRKGKRRDIGRDPVNPASIDKLVAELLGESGLTAARARPQSRRTETDGLVFDLIATSGANGLSACLRVVPLARPMDEIDLDMPEPPPSVAPTSTGSFLRASAPPVLTLDGPFDLDVSRATSAPSMPPPALDGILEAMASMRASDLHLTAGACPAIRVDGDLSFLVDRPIVTNDEIRGFLQSLGSRPGESSRGTTIVHTASGGTRYRVSVSIDHAGTSVTVRRLGADIVPLESYGLPAEVLAACRAARGLVLVSGARGSGKSTLVASILDYVNRTRAVRIVSIDDPIEIVHTNQRSLVSQRQVGEHTPSVAEALRGAHHADVDVVVIGDLRDGAATKLALEAAEDGRLVVAAVPASGAATASDRLLAMIPEAAQGEARQLLASVPVVVIGQVLCRRAAAGTGSIPALELVLGGAVVASIADSLVALVRHGLVTPDDAWSRAPDRDQIAAAFHASGIPFPSG